jgi:hypothetical protein
MRLASAPALVERQAYRDSRLCMAVMRLDDASPGSARAAGRAWKASLRDEDSVTTLGDDNLISLTGCPTAEAVQIIQRLRGTTPSLKWTAGIASWDHAESDAALLGRALRALSRAEERPGSIVMARVDE